MSLKEVLTGAAQLTLGAIKDAAAKLVTAEPGEVKALDDTDRRFIEVQGGDIIHDDEPKQPARTHHPFLHPTKGWRDHSMHAGTNRRRKLSPYGRRLVYGALVVPDGE